MVTGSVTMLPSWAEVTHEDVWTHHHPWYALEHVAVSWMTRVVSRRRGKSVGEVIASAIDDVGWMTVVGGVMVIAGIAILIPGPAWGFAALVGYAVPFLTPTGAVVAYAVFGAMLVLGGLALIYFD